VRHRTENRGLSKIHAHLELTIHNYLIKWRDKFIHTCKE